MKQRRVRIVMGNDAVSDRIIDADTGEDLISTCTAIEVWCDKTTGMKPVAKITIIDPEIDVVAEVEVETRVMHP